MGTKISRFVEVSDTFILESRMFLPNVVFQESCIYSKY